MNREILSDFIRKECLRRDREYVLSSGRRSLNYFDLKKLMLHGEHGFNAADELLDVIANRFPHVDIVGGTGAGGELVIVSLFIAARARDYPIRSGFLIHNDEGVMKVSNAPPPGTDVIVVDDVATTGRALGIARDFVPECNVVGGAVVLDRSYGEAEQALGFPVVSAFTESNFLE